MKDVTKKLHSRTSTRAGRVSRRSLMALTAASAASAAMGSLFPRNLAAQVNPLQIKACVFDTFGTLVGWRGSVARQVKAVADAKGVEGDWFDFADQWRGYYYRLAGTSLSISP